ncbi:MAG: O-methyltransferase [Longicatena sp.]
MKNEVIETFLDLVKISSPSRKERVLADYIKDNSSTRDELLGELERKTNILTVQPRMMSGHIQGAILKMITHMTAPRRVVEIGTFTGYSALCMASAMEEGSELHTIDINDEIAYIAEEYFERSGLGAIIRQHIGSALDVIPQLGGVFDLVFMDGDKREYVAYYDLLMDGGYLRSGSFILADNVLWDGKVVDRSPKNLKDKYTATILEFNRRVSEDSRVEVIIMPFRDGMSIIRVK